MTIFKSNEKKLDFCPRLIDYLVICGIRHPGQRRTGSSSSECYANLSIDVPEAQSGGSFASSLDIVQNPDLLRRYPVDDHKDFQLPTDVVCFCQPEGCISVESKRQTFRDASSFVFTLTEKDSAKIRYGICVNFYRTYEKRPPAAKPNGTGEDLGQTASSYPPGSVRPVNLASARKLRPKRAKKYYTLTSLCIISHHPFFTTFRQTLTILRKLIDACNVRASSKKLSGSKIPRDSVWAALSGQLKENIPAVVMHEIRELETWILKLLSAPVPVPGKTRVELQILPDEFSDPLIFGLPDHTRFSLVDFPLHLPLELLNIDSVIKVLTCIILEYKVVLQSRDFNAVSMCVLSLVSLLYPLEYLFPVIPLLPNYLAGAEHLFLAPTPFVIGIPASFFNHKKLDRMPSDIVLVDLDSDKVILPRGIEFPDIPEPEYQLLKNHFRQALTTMTNRMAEQDGGNQRIASGVSYTDTDSVDVASRVAMVRFFNSSNILANFTEHTRTLRLYPRPVVALQGDSFIRSRPVKSEFIRQLARTQAVEYFAEWSLSPKNEAYLRVQNGVVSPSLIGDKVKWFSDQLQPVRFPVYQQSSTLAAAWSAMAQRKQEHDMTDESAESGSDAERSVNSSLESISDLLFESPVQDFDPLADFGGRADPLGQVDDVYQAPLRLELPGSDSLNSLFESSQSSVLSSPSSISTSNLDSENDLPRLVANLALKSDANGGFQFDKPLVFPGSSLYNSASANSTPETLRKRPPSPLPKIVTPFSSCGTLCESSDSTPTQKTPTQKFGFKTLTSVSDSSDSLLGSTKSHLMSALGSQLNGYADKTQNVFSELVNKTAPAAQKIKEKTMNPFPKSRKTLVERSSLIKHSATALASNKKSSDLSRESQEKANQQTKNQQTVKEICDAVVHGHGVGVFTFPKLKRLMEDESLRTLVCCRLNFGLERKHISEDDFLEDSAVPRPVCKGIVRVLQTCLQGLEYSYSSSAASGLASTLHLLEIAHTHYWTKEVELPGGHGLSSGQSSASHSVRTTPSASVADISKVMSNRDGQEDNSVDSAGSSLHKQVSTEGAANRQSSAAPPRPPPPKQESLAERKRLGSQASVSSLDLDSPQRQQIPTTDSSSTPRSGGAQLKQINQANIQTRPVYEKPTPVTEQIKVFVYTELLTSYQCHLWSKIQFWEDVFFDAVAQERDILVNEQEPQEMLERYSNLSEPDRKRLELDEDRLLVTLLHNMTALMLMCNCPKSALQQKIRRLLGKAHIGLIHSQQINELLDCITNLSGNDIKLKPLASRLAHKQSFTVHRGSDALGDMMFMDVCDDAIVLRAISGSITERLWYEQLVNMTYSPKTKVLCLWRQSDGKVHLDRYYSKKCRDLYNCIKGAMERAAARGKIALPGKDLGGEFPVQDVETNQGGLLQVRIDGIALTFADRKWFIELANIKKCNTYGGNVFVLEELDRKRGQLIQRKYLSQMADQICYAILCVFSYIAAQQQGKLHQQQQQSTSKLSVVSST